MKTIFFCLILALSACNLKEQEKVSTKTYFDLDGYFKKEAARLTTTNPTIRKTVWVNGKAEEKTIAIKNWEKEFDSFISSDINKASWRGSFKLKKAGNVSTYTTQSAKIPVKKVEIVYDVHQKVKALKIFVVNTNDLYTSKDTLSYFADSLYQIKKVQQIRLMKEKKYEITGKFQ